MSTVQSEFGYTHENRLAAYSKWEAYPQRADWGLPYLSPNLRTVSTKNVGIAIETTTLLGNYTKKKSLGETQPN